MNSNSKKGNKRGKSAQEKGVLKTNTNQMDIMSMFSKQNFDKKEKEEKKQTPSKNRSNSKREVKKTKDKEKIKKSKVITDVDEEILKPSKKSYKDNKKIKKNKIESSESYSINDDNEEEPEEKNNTKTLRKLRKNKSIEKEIEKDEDLIENSPKEKNKSKEKNSILNKKSLSRSTAKKNNKNDSSKKNSNEIIGPLNGETIVLTGECEIDRKKFTDILKSLGAKVTGSVSSRTTILIHGEQLEDGRPFNEGRKYKEAQKHKTNIFSQYEFEDYMRKKLKNNNWSLLNSNNNDNSSYNESLPIIEEEKINKENNSNSILWTDKYKPKTLNDIIGNKAVIEKLIKWLDDWNDVILKGNKKQTKSTFRGGRPQFENINAAACLISGEPGIGKTTAVRVIAKIKGYQTYETNASLQRNKNSINQNVGFLFDNTTIFTDDKKNNFISGELKDKNLIIMDEIDGMSGNDDRGGIAALISIIKKTKIPIICICNDRQNQKLKTLINYCYDLKFSKPDKRQIVNRLIKICGKENLKVENNALELICESCNNDIRQCINFLELYKRNNNTIKYNNINNNIQLFNKDEFIMLNNFQAATKLLNSQNKKLPFRDLLDLYFIDYDLIPLLIHENYLSNFKYNNNLEELSNLSYSTDLISESDKIDKKIRFSQNWSLLLDRGILGSISICHFTKGVVPFPKFPEIMGKMSSIRKIKREINELKKNYFNCNVKSIKNEICPLVLNIITDYINDNNYEEALNLMKRYKITMDILKENVIDLTGEKIKKNFEKVGTSIKSAFTKEYNKNFKTSVIKVKKGKTSKTEINNNKYDEEGNLIEGDDLDENNKDLDEEEETEDKIIKIKNDNKDKSKKLKGNIKKNKKKNKKSKRKKDESFIDDEEL